MPVWMNCGATCFSKNSGKPLSNSGHRATIKNPRALWARGLKFSTNTSETAYRLRCGRNPVYITPNEDTSPYGSYANMFDHLVLFEPEVSPPGTMLRLDDASPEETLAAQVATSSWLEELGVPPDDEVIGELEKADARKAFSALSTNTNTLEQKAALVQLKTPEAVRHLTGMLSAYDWEFIEQAKQLRGYTVAKIVEETTNPNASVRLKALALLGKVTEVGLFTDKIEIKKTEMSDAEVEQRIKDKLNKFMGVIDVVDIAASDVDLPENGSSFKLTPEETPDEPVKTDDADKA
jgi:hypothetical protein